MNYDPDGDPVFYNALRKYIQATSKPHKNKV